MKKDETNRLESLVIEHNAQARITLELARQLEGLLPIASMAQMTEQIGEVVVQKNRLPLKIFAPHVGNELFPITDVEDLVRKLSGGVRTALALGHSLSFPVSNPSVRSILATTRQEDPERRLGIPIVFGGRDSFLNKGGV